MDGPAEFPTIDWQPSSASEILDSPKILGNICANLSPKKELLSMALSCKAISSIALDEIWRSRRSMDQLLAPLFCDGFITTLAGDLYLCRVLMGESPTWARFCDYASRIQVLAANENFFGRIHQGIMLRLMQLTGDQPIFPHLRSLTLSDNEVRGRGGTVVSGLPLFVSPNLFRVSIQIQSNKEDATISAHLLQSFLLMVQVKGVPLKHLSLQAKIPVCISSFFSSLAHANTLRTLHLEGVRCLDADNTSWITDLGLLESLEELKLIAEEDMSNRRPSEASRPPSLNRKTRTWKRVQHLAHLSPRSSRDIQASGYYTSRDQREWLMGSFPVWRPRC
ncbi:hypothetical protein BKA70DRAFT_677856 [Coprinopsis sp. MPI-PUGE-AT-0042]|nr:hypothetical protein BKA70DRAFT_677856 [Coprinopsis sp. MPI-PUGE-AT-0042]